MSLWGSIMIVISIHSWSSGQLVPLTLELFILEVELPNGGQLVGLLLGAGALLGGITGIWLVARSRKTKDQKEAGGVKDPAILGDGVTYDT